MNDVPYRGRLAPSPTGLLHIGHARTFWTAQQRAEAAQGVLILRNEDIDAVRAKMDFADAMIEDMRWLGLRWQEGPDCGGPFGPYEQSKRRGFYEAAFEQLRAGGWVYPCRCTRKDVMAAVRAPHATDEGPIYPGTCRPDSKARARVGGPTDANGTGGISADCGLRIADCGLRTGTDGHGPKPAPKATVSWRFRVPDGESIEFMDGCFGRQRFVAGEDFGDFVVWRHDGVPSYQLVVVVDDAAMKITEVVRGADLLLSTARQLLLYRALGLTPPAFYHCPLMTDEAGVRLAKRHDALSLRTLRQQGIAPEAVRVSFMARG